MHTYRPVAILGHDFAIQDLTASMTTKRLESGGLFSLIGTGDAAAACRTCESRGST